MAGRISREERCQTHGIDEYRSLLAKKCGVERPETRLFEDKYFGVKHFNRTSNSKLHVVSVAGLIRAEYRMPKYGSLQFR